METLTIQLTEILEGVFLVLTLLILAARRIRTRDSFLFWQSVVVVLMILVQSGTLEIARALLLAVVVGMIRLRWVPAVGREPGGVGKAKGMIEYVWSWTIVLPLTALTLLVAFVGADTLCHGLFKPFEMVRPPVLSLTNGMGCLMTGLIWLFLGREGRLLDGAVWLVANGVMAAGLGMVAWVPVPLELFLLADFYLLGLRCYRQPGAFAAPSFSGGGRK